MNRRNGGFAEERILSIVKRRKRFKIVESATRVGERECDGVIFDAKSGKRSEGNGEIVVDMACGETESDGYAEVQGPDEV